MELALPDHVLPDPDPQLLTGSVEARQTGRGHCGLFPVDQRQIPVSHGHHVAYQRVHPPEVVRDHRSVVIEHVVNGHHRQIRVHQLQDHGVREVRSGDHHAVHASVKTVLKVGAGSFSHAAVDEGDIVPVLLRLFPDPVQDSGEKLVGQSSVHRIHEEDADIVGPVGLQGPGGSIGHIPQLLRFPDDPLPGLFPDILLTAERLAYRSHRDIARFRNIFHGYHAPTSPGFT